MSKEKLEKLYKDRLSGLFEEYPESREKATGSNSGFIGSRDDEEFMLKSAKMYPSNKKEAIMKNDLLHEYMAYFERFMYDKVPVLGVVTEENKKEEKNYKFRIVQDLKKEEPQDDEVLIGIVDFELSWKKGSNSKIKEIDIEDDGIPADFHTMLISKSNSQTQLNQEEQMQLNNYLGGSYKKSLYLRSKMLKDFKPLNQFTHYKIVTAEDIDYANPKHNEVAIGIKEQKLYIKRGVDQLAEEVQITNNLKKGIPNKVAEDLKNYIIDSEKPGFKIMNYFEQHLALKYGYINQEKLNNVDGFEKAIATSAFFGDLDFNGGNLGFVDGKIDKVDHGRACSFFTDEAFLRKSIEAHLNIYCYQNLNLDATKLKSTVDEITKISNSEIEDLVKQKAFYLRKAGFVLDDDMMYYENGIQKRLAPADETAKTSKEIEDSRWKNLEENYIRLHIQQKDTFKALSHTLDKVINLDMPPEWKYRRWIYDLKGDTVEKWKEKRNDKENIIQNVNNIVPSVVDSKKTALISR